MDIAEVRLQTHQLSTLYDFYANTFGLEVVDHTPDAFTLVTGSSRVIFEQVSDGNTVPQYHIAWNIPVNRFDEAKVWASERAELLVIPEAKFEETKGFTRKRSEEDIEHYEIFFIPWNANATYFCDPVGNILGFIARHELKNASNEPFDHRSFLSISEVGMVVDDVIATTELVCHTLGATVYSKIDDIFAAIGDINGLFIVVKKGHQWFPTMRDALVFPTQVKVRGKQFNPFNLPDSPHMICELS